MDSVVGFFVIVCVIALLCGLIASSIAKNKGLSSGGYFMLGFLLGLVGIAIAACVRPADPPRPTLPPGWYSDPWRQAVHRWWDGTAWTGHVSPAAPGAGVASSTGQ